MSTVSGFRSIGLASEFNPRIRLDLSSGKGSLFALKNSIGQLSDVPRAGAATPHVAEPSRHVAIDYERAIALMTGRHTKGMHERHVATLHKISSLNSHGFFFSDAGPVSELLNLAGANLASGRLEYAPALCEMLHVLSSPLQKQRCNDDERFEKGFVSMVRAVGSLVASAHTQVSVAAVDMMLTLLVSKPTRGMTPEGIARESVTAGLRLGAMSAQKLIAESGATFSALSVLTNPASPPQVLGCMRLLRVLSKAGDTAKQIASSAEFSHLFKLLEQPLSEPTLALSVETVWNLLDNELATTSERLSSVECVKTLTKLHLRSMVKDTCDTDKELRNEVFVIGSRLAQSSSEARAALVHGGFFEVALRLVCGDGVRGMQLATPSLVNLELLQLALQFLQVMLAGHSPSPLPSEAFEQLASMKLPGAMAELLDLQLEAATIWSEAQLQELRLRAMSLLGNLAVVCPSELAALPHLARILVEYLSSDVSPELRDGTLHILVDALPQSPQLQQQLGQAVRPSSHSFAPSRRATCETQRPCRLPVALHILAWLVPTNSSTWVSYAPPPFESSYLNTPRRARSRRC